MSNGTIKDSVWAFVGIRANITAETQDVCIMYFRREVQLQDDAVGFVQRTM